MAASSHGLVTSPPLRDLTEIVDITGLTTGVSVYRCLSWVIGRGIYLIILLFCIDI